jgi:hypothetical protein
MWFILGLFIGAACGVFALGVVTRRCTCYPEDKKDDN